MTVRMYLTKSISLPLLIDNSLGITTLNVVKKMLWKAKW